MWHCKFAIWLFVRHVGGEVSPAPAFDQGFVLDDDANAFFTTAENFAQLQVSEPSSQRVDFDRSTGRFAAEEGGFVGVNTIVARQVDARFPDPPGAVRSVFLPVQPR